MDYLDYNRLLIQCLLEIYLVTGKKKSAQKDEKIPRFDFICVSVGHDRETLYERINLRVEEMFRLGLKEEVIGLLAKGVTSESQCMQGIGYKEVVEGLALGMQEEEIKEIIKKNTRNYAKRQLTYFKRMENHTVLSPQEDGVAEVLKML